MTRLSILLTLVILISSSALGQSTTSASPTPTPKPATRRPALDQFGLGSGVFANSGSTNANNTPLPKEYVDQDTFDIVIVVIEKSEFLERELSRALSAEVDISPTSGFRKYFEHHIVGLMHVSEVQRTGRFGGAGIKSGELMNLLQRNERTVREIIAVLGAGPAEYARFSNELNGVSEKYGVPLLESPSAGTRLDKPTLLKAMMASLNGNYALAKKFMAVKK